jgi:hypothetical protein
MQLLNSNYKLQKAKHTGLIQLGLELLPGNLGGGENLCPFKSKGCFSVCLQSSGHSNLPSVQNKRMMRTKLFLKDKVEFLRLLVAEINYYQKLYKNITVRPNVFSEIQWKDIYYDGKNLFEHCPDTQFLDYVKSPFTPYLNIPNYFVVFSGQSDNQHIWKKMLQNNIPVSLVFEKDLPAVYANYEVCDGDIDDNIIKFKNKPVIIGLRYKKVVSKNSNNLLLREQSKLVIKL